MTMTKAATARMTMERRLRLALPELTTDGLPLNLVWPIGRQLQPKVDAMLELLAAELRID
ncbi:hypothetical protein [Serratia fonticola]|uniref:hypothetical protein n=1 Tax=Serratia fonticola TaxID=47917 RepID=UPI001C310E04|nr:hypothetical protein [Serratia fonticola]